MSTILNAILTWAETPGIEIQEMKENFVQIQSPIGTATVILKDDTYEVVSSSEQLRTKIEEVIERALLEERAIWQRGHEWYAPYELRNHF